MTIVEAVRVLGVAMISFFIAFTITPIVTKILYRFRAEKQIRSSDAAPIYAELHKGKAGPPTMGGVIVWVTVLFLAVTLFILSRIFDGFFSDLNFIDRAQTYLPLAAMFIAATLGLVDDVFGVLKIGPHGGGLKVRHKIIMYSF